MWWPEDPGVDDWRGLDLTALEVDEAYLNVTSDKDAIFLYSLSTDCHKVSHWLVQCKIFSSIKLNGTPVSSKDWSMYIYKNESLYTVFICLTLLFYKNARQICKRFFEKLFGFSGEAYNSQKLWFYNTCVILTFE